MEQRLRPFTQAGPIFDATGSNLHTAQQNNHIDQNNEIAVVLFVALGERRFAERLFDGRGSKGLTDRL